MEHVRTGAALGPEVIGQALRLVLAWGALALPMSVSGHNGEVLVARLTLRTNGSCAMRVTADLDANYLIRDQARMTEAMADLFLLSTDSGTAPFTREVGEPALTVSTKLETDSPFQHTPEELAKAYRLQNAEWEWQPAERNFVIRMPEASPHTVLLWMLDERKPGEKARWTMMVAGDESPLISAHEATSGTDRRNRWTYMALTLLAILAGWLAVRRLAGRPVR
ncbi:MAG: hypothetical protein FJ410_08710 [Verrucomicrobia bacterium]|nr:hypothetical protein [Verrucomicrobiota bacterium]